MGMNILDSRKTGSTITTKKEGTSVVITDGSTVVCGTSEESTIVANPKCTEIVSLDGMYLEGPKGETGDAPAHEWTDTELRFRNPDGTWGVATDLEGKQGPKGDQGIQGPRGGIGNDGPAGPTKFVWAKYSDTTTPSPGEMFNDPTDRTYVGLAYNREILEGGGDPLEFDYRVYSWSKIQGADGLNGTPGNPGPEGPEGPAGDSFTWIGEFSQHPTEVDIGRPLQAGDSYLNTTDQRVYTYSGGWHLMLDSGAPGPIGPEGPQGAPGGGFQYQGEFASSPPGAVVNWLYRNSNNGLFYMYTSNAAWELATSDGKAGVEGVNSSLGWYFYTTYSANAVGNPPSSPTLDGNSGEWLASPYEHPVGTINWLSQKIVQSTDGNQGVWNTPTDISAQRFRGPEGFRGSQSVMVPIVGWSGAWNDRDAEHAVGGAPQEWDVVTMYKSEDPNVQETKRWGYNTQTNDYEWLAYNYVFLGDVLVDGSLDAQKINVNSELTVGTGNEVAKLSGSDTTWRIAAGNASMGSAPFRVDKVGKMWATNADITGNITATSGSFTGAIYASSGTFTGTVSGSSINSSTITSATITGGTINGANGNFTGTIYAENISGDVVRVYSVTAGNIFTIPAVAWDRKAKAVPVSGSCAKTSGSAPGSVSTSLYIRVGSVSKSREASTAQFSSAGVTVSLAEVNIPANTTLQIEYVRTLVSDMGVAEADDSFEVITYKG